MDTKKYSNEKGLEFREPIGERGGYIKQCPCCRCPERGKGDGKEKNG